jgi:hypothetical protein
MSLDATVGSPNANSYITINEATNYFADRAFASNWDDFDNQSALLITASKQLDWYVTWKGTKFTSEQAMDWPRNGVVDELGSPIPTDIIPKVVKEAVAELALSSLDGDRTADNDLAGLAMVQASTLKVQTDGGGSTSTARDTIPDKIWKMLSGLTTRSGIGVVRLMRA